tara:strand:- start:1853 stop:2245 length:393 start_codon:yes stop_codon:yes gene_type:complete
MANPNIVSVSSIKGESVGYNLTATTTTTLMTVSADKLVKINRISCANVDGTNAASVNISVTKSNYTPDGIANFDTSGTFFIAKEIVIPPAATVIILENPLYLQESDVLKGGASAASDLDLVISFESIDDA